MALPPLILRVVADTRQAQASLTGLQATTAKFGGAARLAAVAGGIALAGFAVKAVKAASDSEEAQNKANETFGQAIGVIDEFAASSSQLGIAASEAHDMTAAFGQMFKTAGFAEAEAADMSITIAKLAADMASFSNQDPSEMLARLQSGLAGQARPLRAFGVFLSDAAIKAEAAASGIAALGTELTDAQKVQARYNLILKQTADQHGDFSRTLGFSLPNQLRVLQAEVENLASDFGAALVPAALGAVRVLGDLLNAIKPLILAFGELLKFVGQNELAIVGLAAAVNPLLGAFVAFSMASGDVARKVGEVATAMWEEHGAAQGATGSADSFGSAISAAGQEAADARGELEKLADAQRSLSGGAVGLVQSFSTLQSAQQRVNDLAKDGQKGTREYKDALAAQVTAQIDLTAKVDEWRSALNTAGASQRDVIADVRQFAKDAGLSAAETSALVKEIKSIPSQASTKFSTPGLPDAIASAEHWARVIAGIPRHVAVAMQFRALNQPPEFHTGGVFRAPTSGGSGLAVLHDRERIIPAGSREEPHGEGLTVIVEGNVYDKRIFQREVLEAIDRASQRGRTL